MPPRQLALFAHPRQARRRRRESRQLWAAVQVVRARGWRVWARGYSHAVNGRQLTSAQLVRLARSLCVPSPPAPNGASAGAPTPAARRKERT